jgi:two-component system response regulator YesN
VQNQLFSIEKEGLAYILDAKDRCIAQFGQRDLMLPSTQGLVGPDGILHQRINDAEAVIAYTVSAETGWKYVSVTPRSLFMKKVAYIERVTLLITLACFLVGIPFAFLLARRNFEPIRTAMDSLVPWSSADKSQSKNELEFIRDSVVSAITRNGQLERAIREISTKHASVRSMVQENRNMVLDGLLASWVRGRQDVMESVETWLSFYEVSLPYSSFVTMLVHVDAAEADRPDVSRDMSLVRSVVGQVVDEISASLGRGLVGVIEADILAIVVNVQDSLKPSQIKEKVTYFSGQLIDQLGEHCGITLTVGIGEPHAGLQGVCASYAQASKALCYRILKGNRSVIWFSEIVDRDKEYYYPIDEELQLINTVKAGDFEHCSALLGSIFEKNFSDRKLEFRLVQCLFFDIMSTALKILDSISIHYSTIAGGMPNPMEKLIACETIDDMFKVISDLYRIVCQHVRTKRTSDKTLDLKQRLLMYLREHCHEAGLSQNRVADDFGISYSYLSKFFNREMGKSIVDYINDLRIQRARELLLETNLPLEEIANRIGYASSKNMIRVFKNHEGTTPGNFRKFTARDDTDKISIGRIT